MDFRSSLYNHSLYHVKKGTVSHRFALDKSKFSFRNVHMNLGNVRWYSTRVYSSNDAITSICSNTNANGFVSEIVPESSSIATSTIKTVVSGKRTVSKQVVKRKKENRASLSEKLLKKVNRNSFKPDSDIYLYLGRYLKESPINEETQRNIEQFLLD
jgi:hypothetical protein